MRKKTPFQILSLGLLLVAQFFSSSRAVSAPPAADVTNDQPTLNFPESITFHVNIENSAKIASVALEYGTEELTCGQVIAKAFPQFTPGNSVAAEWTWEMKQSGSLPPGASMWWRWRYIDESGKETVTDQKTVTWLDSQHNWQTLTAGDIRLHWYSGAQVFSQELLDAAVNGLARVEKDAGLQTDKPVDLYIYASANDMKDAILYEPSWTGGEAFPEHNIVIIGITPDQLEWGKTAEVHELTHVLVGHLTFSCLGDVPTWLNEGLAVYAEGQLDPASQNQLDDAIRNDTLLTVRSLSGGFSEVPDKAYLSYSESYSIVQFLIETYGREKMTSLLLALRDGTAIDEALQKVYGFDVGGLEDAWRAAIGARPRRAAVEPTAQPTPTFVPTIVPISGAPVAVTPTPFTVPVTPVPLGVPGGPPLTLTLILVFTCCALGLIFGVLGLGIFLTRSRKEGGSNEKAA